MKLSHIPSTGVERCQGKTEARSIAVPVALEKGKKPVGDQPFATAGEIRRIDPRWVPGPVPPRFCEDEKNRRNYLLWLGWKLGSRKMRDWYRLKIEDFGEHHGNGVLPYWSPSAAKAIRECFPEYDWQEWLLCNVPQRFWNNPANGHRFFRWLGIQLGYRRPTDWYAVRHEDIIAYGGCMLLRNYSSILDLLREYLPDLNWDQPFGMPSLEAAADWRNLP